MPGLHDVGTVIKTGTHTKLLIFHYKPKVNSSVMKVDYTDILSLPPELRVNHSSSLNQISMAQIIVGSSFR